MLAANCNANAADAAGGEINEPSFGGQSPLDATANEERTVHHFHLHHSEQEWIDSRKRGFANPDIGYITV